MAYKHTTPKGQVYVLHKREAVPKQGQKPRSIYFFTKEENSATAKGEPCDIPEGYKIVENKKNQFPLLSKIKD